MSRPLRVLEITTGVAGAVCGRLFAGLGHDVVLVEREAAPGLAAHGPFGADGQSLTYAALHADKRAVRGADAGGLTASTRILLDDADVLVSDVDPDTAAALGIAADHLRASHPELVVVSVTGFGSGSPFSGLPPDSLLAEAYGGLATMIGLAGRRPLSLGGDQAAYCAGVTGYLGALLAVLRREQGLGGDAVEVAMCDVAAYMDWKSDVNHFMTGRSPARAEAGEGDWRLIRSADGWAGLIFLPRHWPAVVELIDDDVLRVPDLADERVRSDQPGRWWPAVERWAAQLSAETIYERAQSLGLPFGWVVRMSDLVASDQLRDRGFIAPAGSAAREDAAAGVAPAVGSPIAGPSWRSGAAPSGPGSPALAWRPRPDDVAASTACTTSGLPLDGVVVLDFGTITAGAAVTRILADHGATVWKVEWFDRPDTFRTWKLVAPDPQAAVTSPYFASNNVGKLDVAVDLKSEEGQALVRHLAARAHVVVENFRVGVTRRLGIDEPTLRAANPDLIYLSLSSQGQVGPESANRSFGSTLDLLSGLASLTGYEEDHPMWSSYEVNYPDQLVSLMGAAALVHCVQQRLDGLHLDVSQREVVSWTLGPQIAEYLATGQDSQVTGNRRPGAAPRDTYPSGEPERWIAIACVDDAERAALARWLGRPEAVGKNERWWTEHADEIDRAIIERTTVTPRDGLIADLLSSGVPAVPVLNAAERAADGRFTDRQVTFATGEVPVKGFPMTFSEYRPARNLSAPEIGSSTREVLLGPGGLSRDQLERLEQTGAVRCVPGTDVSTGEPPARVAAQTHGEERFR